MSNKHFTQWAAQFAVASELCKCDYQVSFTLGHNTPLADLVVISPKNRHFLIDVKGLAGQNYWRIKKKQQQENNDLFYVLALVPRDAANQFFVMTQECVNRAIDDEFGRLPREKRAPVEKAYQSLGVRWKDALPYLGKWCVLPK